MKGLLAKPVNGMDWLARTALRHGLKVVGLSLTFCVVTSCANAPTRDLIFFATAGDVSQVQSMAANDGDVNQTRADGTTALMSAVKNGHIEVVQVLIAAKANVDARNASGETALILAAQNGQLEIVRTLLDANATMNVEAADGSTALSRASDGKHVEVVQALTTKDLNASTALLVAAKDGDLDQVHTLLQRKADPNSASTAGTTPLIAAAQNGQLESVRVLLLAGANANKKTADGVSPLMAAAGDGDLDVVNVLLKNAADPRAEDRNGFNAIYFAARKFNYEAVSRLLQVASSRSSAPEPPPPLDTYDDVKVLSAQLEAPLPATIGEANLAIVQGDNAALNGSAEICRERYQGAAELWDTAAKHFKAVASKFQSAADMQELKRTVGQAFLEALAASLQQAQANFQARQNQQIYALSHAQSMAQYNSAMTYIRLHHPKENVVGTAITAGLGRISTLFAVRYVLGMETQPDFLASVYSNREEVAESFATASRASAECCANAHGKVTQACLFDFDKVLKFSKA